MPGYRYEMEKGLSLVDRPDVLRAHILEIGHHHLTAAVDLADPETADFAVHVVTVTDRMQHFFWTTAGGPGDAVLDAYSLAEEGLERLLGRNDWDNVIVVSDHGAGPSQRVFYTDEWLIERGWGQRMSDVGNIDMHASVAYAGEEPEIAVYVNCQEREGFGVSTQAYPRLLRELRDGLMAVRMPEGGSPAFRQVVLAEDIYDGPYRDLGPDLILLPNEGVHPRPGPGAGMFGDPGGLVSGHRIDGVFLGRGVDFPASADRDAHRPLEMTEVFSLLCAAQGLPVPGGVPVSPLLMDLGVQYTFDERLHWPNQVDGEPSHRGDSPDMLHRLTQMGYL
jgi:hypothetical protein